MKIPAEFDAIRPFTLEELPAAVESLMQDEQFQGIVARLYPGHSLEEVRQLFLSCPDNLAVQKTIFMPLLEQLEGQCCKSLTADYSSLPDKQQNYTFVSNHRDIVMDSAFLGLTMLRNGFPTTMEIAIGDNLLIYPWIRTLVRINKSFVVQRSVSLRQRLASSLLMSRYMHYVVSEKHDNLWIAQREGRAKDSNDRTQEAVLKMLAMGGSGKTPVEQLAELHIVPLTISYEYDPCDVLKAVEFQQKRDNPAFKKSPADDLNNMQTGIFGYKGRVRYVTAPCINQWLEEYADRPKSEVFVAVAERMDREIHLRYHLYPSNYVAADLLEGSRRFASHYTHDEQQEFEHYVEEKIRRTDFAGKDPAFLFRTVLTMYANPLYNYLRAHEQQEAD